MNRRMKGLSVTGRLQRNVWMLVAGILALTGQLMGADVVTEWNVVALNYFKAKGIQNQFGSRTMAMMHTAIFDAINAVAGTHQPYLLDWPAAEGASMEAAGATAAHQVVG